MIEGMKITPLRQIPDERGKIIDDKEITVTRGDVLIVNLPGSPKGAVESLDAVAGLIPHVVDLLHGRTEHRA